MATDWVSVYSTPELYEAEIIKEILAENEIECVSMNKRDSAYLTGEIEIFVPTDQAFEARQLVIKFQNEKFNY